MDHKPYHNDAETPDEDHPRAGWYIKVEEDGEPVVFGPFSTEPHAAHFADHVIHQHDH